MAYSTVPKYKTVPHVARINPTSVKAYIPALTLWGVAAVFAVGVYTENWPLFEDGIYSKIPILGKHWQKKPDPEDVPV